MTMKMDKKYFAQLAGSVLFLILTSWLNFISGDFIINRFDNVIPPDLLFEFMPYYPSLQYITDVIVIASGLLLFFYVIKNNYRNLPNIIYIIALAYLLRAIIVPLTPLGAYFGVSNSYGISDLKPHGAFPSGHTMFAFLVYFLINKKENVLKYLTLLMALFESFSLILSRGHYTIDIVGGFLLAYFVVTQFAKKDKKSII